IETGLIVRNFSKPYNDGIHNILRYVRQDGSPNWTIADHVSMRTDEERYVIGSTYGGDHTNAPFENEIYLVYMDGSSCVRLGHTRSDSSGSTSDLRYFAQPRASVDRDGRFVIYASNLGSSSRVDVMMLRIPDELVDAEPTAAPGATAPTSAPT